uniref:Uncharacterized protein n=1 Tax=Anguilla anguilla TaxID=7936 RepID=A0A0E9QTR6_ANGAN
MSVSRTDKPSTDHIGALPGKENMFLLQYSPTLTPLGTFSI